MVKYIELPVLLKFNIDKESEHKLYNKITSLNKYMLITFDDVNHIVFGYLEMSKIVELDLHKEITDQLVENSQFNRLHYFCFVYTQLQNFELKKQDYKDTDVNTYKTLKKIIKCKDRLLKSKWLKKRVKKLKKELDHNANMFAKKHGYYSIKINKLKCLIGALEFFCILTVKNFSPRVNNRKVVLYTNRIMQRFIFLLDNFQMIKRSRNIKY